LSFGWRKVSVVKRIRLSAHARERAVHRGATEEEIAAAIREAAWHPADRGRLEASKVFRYDAEWNGTWYATKRVRAVFVDEQDVIIVVTVFAYYGRGGADE
jgi:hypothetical protein